MARAKYRAMFDFDFDPDLAKPALYRDILHAADALTADEPDAAANMANVAAMLWHALPETNWTGFYRMVEGELVLGPFCGKPPASVFRSGLASAAGRLRPEKRSLLPTCTPSPGTSPAMRGPLPN